MLEFKAIKSEHEVKGRGKEKSEYLEEQLKRMSPGVRRTRRKRREGGNREGERGGQTRHIRKKTAES